MNTQQPTQQQLAERLSSRMKDLRIGQTELAELAGTTKQQIYKLEKGLTRLRDEWARTLAPHLKVTPEWLLMLSNDEPSRRAGGDGVSAPEGYVSVPTLEPRAGMGGGGIIDGQYLGAPRFFEEGFVRNELRATPEDLCVVEVEGQSMEPLLRHGDTVLVDRRKVNLGMEGIFVLYDGEYVVCKWAERVHGSEPPMIRIRSSNLDFSPYEVEAERCQILGRVVWFARRL